MPGRLAPALPCRVGGLHGVADVLAIAFGHLADECAVWVQYPAAVSLIGTRLLAADEQLRRTVDGREAGRQTLLGGLRERDVELLARSRVARDGTRALGFLHALHVLPHALAPAFAAVAALTIPAEAGRRVEEVRRIDPDDAALELRRDVEREIDALRPHARGQPERRVVREGDGFLRRPECHRHEHRPEDLDLRDRAGRLHVRE